MKTFGQLETVKQRKTTKQWNKPLHNNSERFTAMFRPLQRAIIRDKFTVKNERNIRNRQKQCKKSFVTEPKRKERERNASYGREWENIEKEIDFLFHFFASKLWIIYLCWLQLVWLLSFCNSSLFVTFEYSHLIVWPSSKFSWNYLKHIHCSHLDRFYALSWPTSFSKILHNALNCKWSLSST